MATLDEPLYVFVHVSKAGGTTVEEVLARRFGRRLQRTSPRPGDRRWPRVEQPRCFSGHRILDDLDRIRSHDDVRWLTWVRDPFRSAVSTYYYTRDVLAPQHPTGAFFVDRGLRTWLTHAEHGGWPLPPGYPHGRMMGTLRNLEMNLDDFAFVGVTERFTESMLLMFHTLAWQPLPFRPLNPMRSQKTGEEREVLADPEVLRVFRERNADDYELYDGAVRRLDGLRTARGPAFDDDLAEYERAMARYDRRWRLLLENPLTNVMRRVWRSFYNSRMRAAVARKRGS